MRRTPAAVAVSLLLVVLSASIVWARPAETLPAVTVTAAWDGAAVVADGTPGVRLGAEASGSSAAPAVTFTVDCGGATCTGYTLTEITASFGDGDQVVSDLAGGVTRTWQDGQMTQSSGASATLVHRYDRPGRHRVAVQVVAQATGEPDSFHVTRYLDVDVAAASADAVDIVDTAIRDAVLRLAAADVLAGCGPAVASVHAVAPSRTGRQLFCPDPAAVYTAAPEGSGTGGEVNAQSGRDCLERYYVCGLDPVDFHQGGSPLNWCHAADCRPVAGLDIGSGNNPSVELLYAQGRCGDGWRAELDAGAWTLLDGVDEGCVTRGELYGVVLALIEGKRDDGQLDGAVSCTDSGSYTAAQLYPVLRAQTLGIPALRDVDPDLGGTLCAPDQAARRDEAYIAIGAALGAAADPVSTGLVDLADLHLGYTPLPAQGNPGYRAVAAPLPQPNADLIAGALAQGVPLPADTSCPDGVQSPCLNPDMTISRGDLAVLLSAVLVR